VTRVYKSKIDAWLVWVLTASAVLPVIAVAASAGFNRARLVEAWPILLILGVSFAFVLWVFLATSYAFDGRALLVRSGPFRWRVPLDTVESVRPSRNPLSSPALSIDRLEVRYGGGKVLLISPREREAFLAELAARAPHAL
jgi:hypothetical protein